VGEVADGEAALMATADTDPDVVLLDVRLPGRDGIAVAELLALRKSPPAVVLTSTTDVVGYGKRMAAAGCAASSPRSG
jgi:DNA-binding NarL/FixJ family response regulator